MIRDLSFKNLEADLEGGGHEGSIIENVGLMGAVKSVDSLIGDVLGSYTWGYKAKILSEESHVHKGMALTKALRAPDKLSIEEIRFLLRIFPHQIPAEIFLYEFEAVLSNFGDPDAITERILDGIYSSSAFKSDFRKQKKGKSAKREFLNFPLIEFGNSYVLKTVDNRIKLLRKEPSNEEDYLSSIDLNGNQAPLEITDFLRLRGALLAQVEIGITDQSGEVNYEEALMKENGEILFINDNLGEPIFINNLSTASFFGDKNPGYIASHNRAELPPIFLDQNFEALRDELGDMMFAKLHQSLPEEGYGVSFGHPLLIGTIVKLDANNNFLLERHCFDEEFRRIGFLDLHETDKIRYSSPYGKLGLVRSEQGMFFVCPKSLIGAPSKSKIASLGTIHKSIGRLGPGPDNSWALYSDDFKCLGPASPLNVLRKIMGKEIKGYV